MLLNEINAQLETHGRSVIEPREENNAVVSPDAPVYVVDYMSSDERLREGERYSVLVTDENGKAKIVTKAYEPKPTCFVAYGEGTRNCIEKLKKLGARFHPVLYIDGNRQAGWVISRKVVAGGLEELKEILGAKN